MRLLRHALLPLAAVLWWSTAQAHEAPSASTSGGPAIAKPKAKAHRAHQHRHRHAAHRHGPSLRAGLAPDAHDHGHAGRGPAHDGTSAHAHGDHEGVETEHLFGFTLGSSVHAPGEKEIENETVTRFGKRVGSYRGIDSKVELHVGVVENVNVSFQALGDCHRVRGVPDLEDVRGRCGFNGFGTELRWRLLDPEAAPFGMMLHLEPSFVRFDELSGKVGRGLGGENKLIFDKELVSDRLFGAVNLLYDLDRFRERGATSTERGSTAGLSAALAYRVLPKTFVGAEVRYLRAYDGLGLDRYRGDAWLVGPNLFTELSKNTWVSLAWTMQVAGREGLDRAGVAGGIAEAVASGDDPNSALSLRHRRLNLRDFERHQVRVKVGYEF